MTLMRPLLPSSQVEVAQKRVLDAERQQGRAESLGSDQLTLISELQSHLAEKEGLVMALQEEAESLQGQFDQMQTEVGGACSNCKCFFEFLPQSRAQTSTPSLLVSCPDLHTLPPSLVPRPPHPSVKWCSQ